MEYAIVIAALVIATAVYIALGARARREVAVARKERADIYRSCFLRGLAGILARMAKADGTVSDEEAEVASRLFNDMGLDSGDRDLCFDSFRVARDSNLPMSYYASLFAPYSTKESRVLIYEILWDITASDGKLDPGEAVALKDMIGWLSIDPAEYGRNEKRCSGRLSAREVGAKIDRVLHR